MAVNGGMDGQILNRSLKILHLATDEKFVDLAYESFERVAPGCNSVIVYGEEPLRYVKLAPDRVVNRFTSRSGALIRHLGEYDIVIIHSLVGIWYRLLRKAPPSVRFVWIGWGFDYYDLVFGSESGGLLPRTAEFNRALSPKRNALGRLRAFLSRCFYGDKLLSISHIHYFAPVLPEEYDLVMERLAACWSRPQFLSWNYGNLEDNLVKGFEEEAVNGVNVLVGNSASVTNNHVEAFLLLSSAPLRQYKIVAPLSYGDARYRNIVEEVGKKMFGKNFLPLVDYMPVQEYVGIIQSCGFVVMNHVRQQALGNIVIMLYLGAKVFLREENPVYRYLKKLGVCIYTVQALAVDSTMLEEGLSHEEKANNRRIMISNWSRKTSDERTRGLIERVIQDSHVNARNQS